MPPYTFINRDSDQLTFNNIDTLEWYCIEKCDQNKDNFPMNIWCKVKSYHLNLWGELKLIKKKIIN